MQRDMSEDSAIHSDFLGTSDTWGHVERSGYSDLRGGSRVWCLRIVCLLLGF